MEEFLKALEETAKPTTVLSYRRDLKCLLEHLEKAGSVSEETLRDYFSSLSHRLSSTGFARAVSVARKYFAFCKERGKIEKDPMEGIRASHFTHREEVFLEPDDMERLLSSGFYGLRGRRDLAMLTLLCETGIKVSELVSLSRKDFSLSERTLVCGSGARKRKIVLTSNTANLIQEISLLSALQKGEDPALFLGSTGKRMTRQGFWKNLKDRAVMSGIESCTPETLRRSLARQLVQQGNSRDQIRSLMGNTSEGKLREYEKKEKESAKWDS